MRRWLTLIGTTMLVLMIWTGTTAHAAETFACGDIATASAEEPGGKRDQPPADPGKSATHHHGGCHGHHVAISNDETPTATNAPIATLVGPAPNLEVKGDGPATNLRPPIA